MKKEGLEKSICRNSSYQDKIEIDCVILCFEDGCLKVLVLKNENDLGNCGWKLPSALIEEEETILNTAQRIVKKYIPEDDFYLEQLKVFGNHSEYSARENLSIGYYAMVGREKTAKEYDETKSGIFWIEADNTANLEEKHRIILDFSVGELKKNICCSAVGFNLLPEKFTLLQVMLLYEEILGIKINKTNFRRKILQRRLVQGLNEKEVGVSYRAATFYTLNVSKQDVIWNMKFNFNF